jgi:hypothetical protein
MVGNPLAVTSSCDEKYGNTSERRKDLLIVSSTKAEKTAVNTKTLENAPIKYGYNGGSQEVGPVETP